MIKAHPTHAMLHAFAAGELPLPLTVGVSAHCELCADCGVRLRRYEAELAAHHLHEPVAAEVEATVLDALLANILQQPVLLETAPVDPVPELQVGDRGYRLPRALARYHRVNWRRFGAIRQHSLPLTEQGARASLLHIEAGGRIPEHTHRGYELTLLLAGSIQDGEMRYQAGDFIWCDANHAHSPHTPDGCLCYTVQDAPVQFTRGLSRLLNGISHRLY
ncbi:ChrR family anti-sigma-E factor [Aeromonas aquatica]|uniref:ChrR family anti-sigma-E factor n=1 Tax=Aeromonas aquatica TaxID=558964 RepID=UPI00286F167F|nr:ChrR family anti-sigma-E factor [Aeromonas aquatica]